MWEEHYEIKKQTKDLKYYPALAVIKRFLEKHSLPWDRNISSGVNEYHRMIIDGVVVDFPYNTKL